MSWQIAGVGTVEAVKRQIADTKAPEGPQASEAPAFEAARKALLDVVDHTIAPGDGSAVVVECSAYGDAQGMRGMSMSARQYATK